VKVGDSFRHCRTFSLALLWQILFRKSPKTLCDYGKTLRYSAVKTGLSSDLTHAAYIKSLMGAKQKIFVFFCTNIAFHAVKYLYADLNICSFMQ